jgi:hypothetical protein
MIEYRLHYGKSSKILAWVRPDPQYPDMWRVHLADGHVSDMVNLTRAKDAATVLARRRYPVLTRDAWHWSSTEGVQDALGGGPGALKPSEGTETAGSGQNAPAGPPGPVRAVSSFHRRRSLRR